MQRPLNPFDPSRPIDPAKFVGRRKEIRELEAALLHAKSDKPRHFLITGERGVGKTSFFDFIRRRATESGFTFAVVDLAINKHTTRLDLARALKRQLDSVLARYPTAKETIERAWSFIQRFEVAGVSYKGADQSENHRDLHQEVADSLCEIVKRVCGTPGGHALEVACDGVLILIDEVDQASDELDIGSFLKYLLEQLNRKGCHRVAVGLAGLTRSTEVLLRSHASSLRIFDELALVNLRREEAEELLNEVQTIVCDGGFGEFVITAEARDMLFSLSGGHPHMLHQFGYCAFEAACGGEVGGELVVGINHVVSGAFELRGALDLIGDMYFRRPFESVSGSPEVLSILDHVSETSMPDSLAQIAEGTGLAQAEVRRSLDALVRAGLLDEHAGCRFGVRHPAFAFWVKAQRPKLA